MFSFMSLTYNSDMRRFLLLVQKACKTKFRDFLSPILVSRIGISQSVKAQPCRTYPAPLFTIRKLQVSTHQAVRHVFSGKMERILKVGHRTQETEGSVLTDSSASLGMTALWRKRPDGQNLLASGVRLGYHTLRTERRWTTRPSSIVPRLSCPVGDILTDGQDS